MLKLNPMFNNIINVNALSLATVEPTKALVAIVFGNYAGNGFVIFGS